MQAVRMINFTLLEDIIAFFSYIVKRKRIEPLFLVNVLLFHHIFTFNDYW